MMSLINQMFYPLWDILYLYARVPVCVFVCVCVYINFYNINIGIHTTFKINLPKCSE